MKKSKKDHRQIFFLISSLYTGGAERQLSYLARELTEGGEDVSVATFYKGGQFWGELSKDSRIHLFSFNRKGRWDIISLLCHLVQHLRQERYEVVQTFLPVANFFGMVASFFAGTKNRYMGIRCSNMQYDGIGPHVYGWLERRISSRLARKIIYNSHRGKEYYEKIGFPKKKSSVIWNGIELSSPRGKGEKIREELGIADSAVVISSVARLDPMKDYPTLLRAFSQVHQQISNIILLVAGDGRESIKGEILEIAREGGVADKVKLLGFRKDVGDILEATDILVSSSAYGEGLSNSIVEAMAQGKSIVATDVGDSKILLGEGRGMIVPVRDPNALAKAIIQICLQKDYRDENNKAREYVKKNLSLSSLAENYLQVWTTTRFKRS